MAYLDGKTAIVTGAAQGLGKAFAERLASEGTNVAICDIRREVLAGGGADLETRGHDFGPPRWTDAPEPV